MCIDGFRKKVDSVTSRHTHLGSAFKFMHYPAKMHDEAMPQRVSGCVPDWHGAYLLQQD